MRRQDVLRTRQIFVMNDPQLRFTFEKWYVAECSGKLFILRQTLDAGAFEQAAYETNFTRDGAAHQTFHRLAAQPAQERCWIIAGFKRFNER